MLQLFYVIVVPFRFQNDHNYNARYYDESEPFANDDDDDDADAEGDNDDDDGGLFNKGQLDVVPDWPSGPVRLGGVGGVAVDRAGDLAVFHRAARVWGPA